MKRLCRMIVLPLALLVSLFPDHLSAQQGARDGIALEGEIMVTTSSIVYHPNDIISMWVKIVPEENSRTLTHIQKLLKGRRKDHRSYEYSSFLSEIDCERRMHRVVSVMHYNKNKNIIHSSNDTNASWIPIDQENGFHILYAAFCSEGRRLMYGTASK